MEGVPRITESVEGPEGSGLLQTSSTRIVSRVHWRHWPLSTYLSGAVGPIRDRHLVMASGCSNSIARNGPLTTSDSQADASTSTSTSTTNKANANTHLVMYPQSRAKKNFDRCSW